MPSWWCSARAVGVDQRRHVAQRHMGGGQHHAQLRPRQHHREVGHARARGQILGVSGMGEPGARDPLLGDRRRDQRTDLAGQRGIDRRRQVGKLGAAGGQRRLSRQRFVHGQRSDRLHALGARSFDAGHLRGALQHAGVAEDPHVQLRPRGQRPDHDLGTDPGGVAKRYPDRPAAHEAWMILGERGQGPRASGFRPQARIRIPPSPLYERATFSWRCADQVGVALPGARSL
jgi:hypothetical protein